MSEKEKNKEDNQKKFDLQEHLIDLSCSQIAFGNTIVKEIVFQINFISSS